jgi:hypothetical protein
MEKAQAARIGALSPAVLPSLRVARGGLLIGEAPGDVGAGLVLAGAGLLVAPEWHRFAFDARVVVTSAIVALMFVRRMLLPDRLGAPGRPRGRLMRGSRCLGFVGLASRCWLVH